MHKTIKAVLLDVDGTLVDSNDAHAQAWLEVFVNNGYATSFDAVRELIGKGGDKLVPQVTKLDAHSHEVKRLKTERSAHFKKVYLEHLRPFPKAAALVQRLKQAGLRIVIASSAGEDELDALLDICGAKPFVEHRTSADDAKHSKPDPDIVHVALAKAGCSPGEAIMVGDTPYDVQAAARAGVRSVAFRCGGHPDSALAQAVEIYDDAAALLDNFGTSVFAVDMAESSGLMSEPNRRA